ncbi:hypothetical protein [Pseudacidovorax sp. RU35E]|nr:hypothetical protein [Pseudacidovorax sp. RU35E]
MTGRDYCVSFRLGRSRVLATLDASALGCFNACWSEGNEFDIVRRYMDGG